MMRTPTPAARDAKHSKRDKTVVAIPAYLALKCSSRTDTASWSMSASLKRAASLPFVSSKSYWEASKMIGTDQAYDATPFVAHCPKILVTPHITPQTEDPVSVSTPPDMPAVTQTSSSASSTKPSSESSCSTACCSAGIYAKVESK